MKNKFYIRLKVLREQRGLSQNDIAKIIGVTKATIQKWEKGPCSPSIKYVIKLANELHIKTDYIIGLID